MNPYLVDDEAPTAPAAPAQAALPKAVARNPYLVDEEGETRGHAALAVSLQTEDNPDTAAQHLAIAKRYKTTPDVVARFSPEFKQRIALEMAQQTLASAPKLAARLSNNPQAGALLHDDLPNAAATENAITSLPASPKFTPIADAVGWLFSAPGTKHGLATDAWRILEAANRSIAGTGAWALGAARAVNDMGLQQSPMSGLEQSLRQIATSGAPAEGFWDKVLETAGSTGGVLLEALATGGSSPLPAAGASTVEAISQLVRHGVKAMSIPSAQTATETAQQVLDATGDAVAATKAGLTAYVTTALGGVIPFATPGKLAYRVGSGMVMGPLQAENTRNAMNLALPDDMQRPVPTMEDRSLDVLTGAMFGGFAGPHEGLQAKLHAEAKRTYTEIGQAEAAVRANAGLEALSKLITAGKDRVRDPEGFKQFVADVADSSSVKELYVDAHVLAQALDSVGITGDQLMQTMPDVASQMREGLQADGMVRLPLEDYAAHLAGSKVDDVLRPHLRIDPEGKTFAEAQTFYQGQVDQLTKTAEKILSEKTADDLFSASAKTVHDTLMGDLSTRNAFPAEVNKLYASHARDFFVVLADEMRITPEEAMAKFPLRVNWTDQLPGGDRYGAPGGLTVDAYHYSKAARPSLSSGFYGTGLQGSGADAYKTAADQRLRQRLSFYVNKGTGVRPEAGVGGIAHKVKLSNIYDANADPLRLRKGGQLAFESRVLDHGYAGYLDRMEGTQPGQVILLGRHDLRPEVLGPRTTIDDAAAVGAPAARESLGRDIVVDALQADKTLPSGAPTVARWQEILEAKNPDALEAMKAAGVFDGDQKRNAYKSDLIKDFEAKTEAPSYAQSVTLRTGKENLGAYGIGPPGTGTAPGGMHNTRDVAAALEARQREKYGTIDPTDRSPEAADKIANWMAEEVRFELKHPRKSGAGWYSTKFQRALDKFGDIFPELKKDKDARSVMTALIAITSDGQPVLPNFRMAADLYRNFKESGTFSTERGHNRMDSIQANMQVLQDLHTKLGAKGMRKYLLQEATVSDLRRIAKVAGVDFKTDYQAHIKLPMAAVVFGPKLGAFYANLMGAHGYLTMDRWWSRTFNRYRGTLLQAPTKEGLARIKQLVGRPEMSDDEAISATIEPRNDYAAKNFKNGTELEKAANTVYKAAFENLEDAPFNATDRTFMLDAVDRAQKVLADEGKKVSVADIQAILWYYEKRLYGDLGARQTADISYEEAAQRVANDLGEPGRPGAQDAGRSEGQDGAGPVPESGDEGTPPGLDLFQQTEQRDGTTLVNIGLAASEALGGKPLAHDDVLAALKEAGADVMGWAEHASDTEPTMVIRLREPLSPEAGHKLSETLKQEAIAQLAPDGGALFGPMAEAWSPFNPDFFLNMEGKRASDTSFSQTADQTQTPAFKAWFGDSKVVDDDGKPLVVYHGTHSDVAAFDAGKVKGRFPNSEGFYFTSKPLHASVYADSINNAAAGFDPTSRFSKPAVEGGNVIPAYVSLQNPKRITVSEWGTLESAVDGDGGARVRAARAAGHDGVIVTRDDSDGHGGQLVIAFKPEQIKSAIGNRGTFDANDPSILHQGDEAPKGWGSVEGSAEGRNQQPGPHSLGVISLGGFPAKPAVITLLEKANASTYLHELGHFFLETYTHIADSPNAPPKIAKDMQTILDGFGVKDVAAWRAMGLEERRPLHEQWAKSYEAYLMEGKAPTIAQQPMFARFSAWLTKVYTSLQALGVKLTPEVRGVMDRMTGSEKAIAEAEQVRGMEALFKVKPEGMTDEAYESYQALGHDATGAAVASLQQRSLRDMQWLSNAKGRAVRSLQRQARAERVKIREEVEAAVAEVPVYRAEDLLAKGIFNGEKVDTGKTHLDTEALAEMYGGAGADGKSDKYALLDWKPLGKLAGPDGIHPDMAAHMLGFESGDALVKALLEREPRKEMVEAMVDKRMLEEHGELIDPASIERAAEAAIHNDMRTRVLATELTALAKATGSARLLAKAAMEAARAAVDAKRVRDLRPGQYQAAEGRSGRAAMEAFRKGDIPGAATQKRAQLLNNALARTAGDAVNEVQKAVDYLKKFEKESTRGNLPPEYLDQIDKLLERVDLRKLSLKQIDRRAKLASWLKAQEEIGIQPDIPEYLLEDAQLVSYKDMTVDQFRGLRDTVKMIEHLGRLKDKMLTARDNRARAVIFEEMANAITSSRGGATANTREPVTDADRRAAKLLTFGASHIKVATYARVFDGKPGGVVWEYLVRPANERSNWQTERRFELTSKLAEIEKPWHDRKDLNTKREIPGLWKVGAPRSPGAKGSSFTFQELLGIALNTGNEGNLQRLMGGEGWTKEQIDNALAAHLTGDDWARVQQIWDTFETLRPEIGAMERRVFGKEPDWVEPMPSTVRVKSGQPVEVRGGYYPIDYDVRASARAEQHAEAEGAKRQLQGAYGAATVRRGFVKDRAVEVNGRPLSYTLETAHEALEKTIHYLAWQEWLIDANRMLRAGSPVEAAVRETWGPDAIGQIKTWRDAIAEGEGGVQQALGTAAGVVRQNVSLAGIGYNLMSGIVQTTGIAQSWRHIGTPWIAKGVSQYASHPLAKTAEVHEKSSFMRSRTRTRYRELNELTNAVRGQHEVMRAMRANAYIFTARVQHMVDMPTWLGAYEKQMAEGKPGTPEEVELRAIAVADQAVKDSQGGGQLVDMSAIQRGDKVAKLFTVFYDFANTQFNMVAGDAMRGGAGKAAATALAAVMLPAMLTPLLKDMLTPGNPDAEEDDWPTALRKAAGEGVSSLMNMLVLVRELADAGKWMVSGGKANDYTGPPGLRTFVDLIKFGKQARQGEFDDAFRKAAVNLSGDVFGIPSSQINRTWNGVEALADGETQNPAALVMGYQKPR